VLTVIRRRSQGVVRTESRLWKVAVGWERPELRKERPVLHTRLREQSAVAAEPLSSSRRHCSADYELAVKAHVFLRMQNRSSSDCPKSTVACASTEHAACAVWRQNRVQSTVASVVSAVEAALAKSTLHVCAHR
jgi:hypothetical protein